MGGPKTQDWSRAMNEDPRKNAFGAAAEARGPEQRPLSEHLAGITAKSSCAEVKAAAESALAGGWPRAEVRKALEARCVGKRKIRNAIPPPPKPSMKGSVDGLAPGFYRKRDGSVWVLGSDPATDEAIEVAVCNSLRALYHTTDGEGVDASIVVETVNIHGEKRRTRLSEALARTDAKMAIRQLIDAGLRPARRGEKAFGEILDAVLDAKVPSARYLVETGYCDFGSGKAFALPSGVIGPQPKNLSVTWDGGTRLCRVGRAGSLNEWRHAVAAPCDGNAIPMVAIGTMLASAAIPFLPQAGEANTMVHIVGVTTTGKTTSLRIGASVWGSGSDTSDPRSFVETWRTTGNASENLLAGHNHVGICLDEMQLLDGKAAWSWAYEFASGRSKHRMNADASAKRIRGWELFALSSGEKTLEDHANDAVFHKRRVMGGGAGARVVNIHVETIFTNLHGQPDAKAFTERLATSASKTYGCTGPAFVEWLLANPNEARDKLAGLQGVWDAVAAAILPPAPSAQAARVASRLGSIACAAALAATVLELPWFASSDPVDKAIDDAPVNDPGRAALWAFAEALRLWIEKHGGEASTEMAALLDDLNGLYSSHPQHFPPSTYKAPKGAKATITDDEAPHLLSTQWGWSVVDHSSANQPKLLFVDVLPSAFTDPRALGWTVTERDRVVRGLRNRGLLIPGAGQLQTTHWNGVRNVRVYRIKAKAFAR
jgi:putative DNA primase/helicase